MRWIHNQFFKRINDKESLTPVLAQHTSPLRLEKDGSTEWTFVRVSHRNNKNTSNNNSNTNLALELFAVIGIKK